MRGDRKGLTGKHGSSSLPGREPHLGAAPIDRGGCWVHPGTGQRPDTPNPRSPHTSK